MFCPWKSNFLAVVSQFLSAVHAAYGTLNDENGVHLLHSVCAGRLLGRRSSFCGAFEPAYQSGPDGLLRTLNCCHGLGQEHAEQFGRFRTVP